MVELYEKFAVFETSICQLYKSYNEYEEDYGTENIAEVELAFNKIITKFNVATTIKAWDVSEELEVLISNLTTKINEGNIYIDYL